VSASWQAPFSHRRTNINKHLLTILTLLFIFCLIKPGFSQGGLNAKSEKAAGLSGKTQIRPSGPGKKAAGWTKKLIDQTVSDTSENDDSEDSSLSDSDEEGSEDDVITEDSEETAEESEEPVEEANEQESEEATVKKPEINLTNPGDWEPFIEMDANFFPSFLISTSIIKLDAPETSDPTIQGDQNGLIGIAVRNPAKGTRVRLTISENLIMNAATVEATLEKADETYFLCPQISFKYDVLLKQKQPLPLSINFALSVDGKEPVTRSKTALIRSINDCPTFYVSLADESYADISFLFAAYVNESHPMIDVLLKEALKTKIVDGFDGYQSGDSDEVIRQVFAIWTALQKRGIKYSSITTPSAHSEVVYSQNVRFIEESLNNIQANCVDGSVLIASVLYKIGINPFLVIVPGHMYLGFYLDDKAESYCCLETTLLSAGKGEDFFVETLQATMEDFQKHEKKFIADNDPDYQIIDIDEARQLGIVPIAFSSH